MHNQVVYAQNGLAIWDQIIEKESLAIHYPKIHLAGHGDEARRMNRYFRKRAKSSMKNYEKATLPDAKLTSHVNYLLSYHGDQFFPSGNMAMITLNGRLIQRAGNWV